MILSRWKSVFALLFALAMVTTACSGDEVADTATDAANTADSVADDAAETADSVVDEAADTADSMAEGDDMAENTGIVVITGSERSEEEAGAIQQVLGAWGEENGIDVRFAGSADWEAEINVSVESGTEPDIAFFPQPGKLADFARAGYLQAVPEEAATAVQSQWDDSSWSFGTVDGTQYGIPAKTDLKSLVWYKPARFEELGYAVPQTLDELMALSDQAVADGYKPWCVGIESGNATGWPFTDWVEEMMLRLHGADVYDQWVRHEIPFNDERVVAAMQAVKDMWADEYVFASGGTISATAFGDNGQALVDDDCLMHRQASFFASFIPEGTPFADGSADAVDVFYFPAADTANKPVLVAGTLAAAFHDRPEVWQVMQYLGSAEYANARQAAQTELKGGGLSGFLSANTGSDMALYSPLEQQMLGIIADAQVARFDGSDVMPSEVGAGTFWSEGTSFVNGDETAQEAADKIEASWP